MRPPLRSTLVSAGCLGLAFGLVEVALRASPAQGLGVPDVLEWLGFSAVIALGASLLIGLGAWAIGFRVRGLVEGTMIGLWATVNYRFEYVLNEFLRDPKVWGGMSAIFLAGVGMGLLAHPMIVRMERQLRVAALVLAVGAIGVALVRAQPVAGTPGERPSVLVISMDTTRFDHLSPYGHGIQTPHLQRLADEGVVFDQAIANAPITEPSHLAMFTGVSPYQSGVLSNGTNLGDRPTLVWRSLKDAGYLTAGFVSGFPLHGKYGWNQGMDVYDDDFGRVGGVQDLTLVKAWNQVAIKEHALRERPAAQVLDRALPWLRANRDNEFFAFVHFYDAHGPYEAPSNSALGPPPTDGPALPLPPYWPAPARAITSAEWLTRAYDNEIVLVDDAIGQLLEALGPRLDQTIVIVTADHGESLTEHDYYFDHGDDLFDPSLRVPFIVRFPPVAKAGTRVACQTAGIDVAPTVLALTGVSDSQARAGRARLAELKGEGCTEEPVVSSTVSGRMVEVPPISHALRARAEKVILADDKPPEAYDLAADPGERQNLYPSERALLAEKALRGLLENKGTVVAAENDAETQSALEALGYLEGTEPAP